MPEDSKKIQHKGKHEAKEQRKPRHQRQHAANKPEKKPEKVVEDTKKAEKHIEEKIAAPPKPAYEEPGPEFYKSLKRETDEILKITEEANAKYKKKEIQSNWTKYEMPIESYEEMEEQENLGADYEKLIQAPMSSGGHFQFKHEKSWDINTAPSLYDKYFEINMDDLATAISTVPFFERNNIDQSVFSQTDLISMNNRAIKYKRKYYNDKSYTTSELEAQDTILNIIKDGLCKRSDSTEQKTEDVEKKTSTSESDDIVLEANESYSSTVNKVEDNLEIKKGLEIKHQLENPEIGSDKITKEKVILKDTHKADKLEHIKVENQELEDIDEVLFGNAKIEVKSNKTEENPHKKLNVTAPPIQTKVTENQPRDPNKPVIESPEDLEKWLDDFLDG